MEEKESCLEALKKNYEEMRKKHNLPSFDDLNKDFSIEKASEEETDYLLREIRRFVSDKIANYLRFVESLIHPVSVPMFVYSVIRSLKTEDMDKLKNIYKKLAKNEVDLVELDIEFSEEKEANFIQNSFDIWQEVKKDLLEVIGVIKENWDNKLEANGKGYFS